MNVLIRFILPISGCLAGKQINIIYDFILFRSETEKANIIF